MAEAIMICIIYVGPFIALITLGAFIMEDVIPWFRRRRARRVRYGKNAR